MFLKKYIVNNILKCIRINTELNSYHISTAILHQKTFTQFKNYCHGKAVVVCGAGPSLQKYKPIEGAVHIALNRAFLYDKVDFDFIFSQDFDGIRMVQEELVEYRKDRCIKLLGTQINGVPEKEIPESLAIRCDALRFNTDSYLQQNGYKSKFVLDIDSRAIGNMPNVGLSCMQFALYMNPSVLYIAGCDLTGSHFSQKNLQEKERKEEEHIMHNYWEVHAKKQIAKWEELKQFAQKHYPDTRLVSVNPVGLRGVFEDLYQE